MDINAIRAQLESDEGKESVVYLDNAKPPNGPNPTGWIGHKLTKEEQQLYPVGATIPEDVGEQWFNDDVDTAIKGCEETPDIPFYESPEVVQDSLVNMAFNMGVDELSKFYGFLSLLRERNWRLAAAHLLTLPYAQEVPERAARIAAAIVSAA